LSSLFIKQEIVLSASIDESDISAA